MNESADTAHSEADDEAADEEASGEEENGEEANGDDESIYSIYSDDDGADLNDIVAERLRRCSTIQPYIPVVSSSCEVNDSEGGGFWTPPTTMDVNYF